MKVRRAFISPNKLKDIQGQKLAQLPDEIAHRFSQVLRLKKGDKIELFDGAGCILRGIFRPGAPCHVEVLSVTNEESAHTDIIVVQAMAKMAKLEQVVQRATELGATGIVLFIANRSVAHWKSDYCAKLARLQRIAQDAARQSGRTKIPYISEPLVLEDLLRKFEEFPGSVVIAKVGSEQALGEILVQSEGLHKGLMFLVGPEGGFSPKEEIAFERGGALFASLGPYVLRTETAALAALAITQDCLLRHGKNS